jgi:cell division protein FtsZ
MIVVPNERLLAVAGKGMPFLDALKKADEVLLNATRGISTLISVTGLVNVDFADVRTVMQNGGSALMGTGTGTGENRALEAAQQAISSPLLDNVSINGATGALVNITGGTDLTLGEVTQISDTIHDAAGEDADVIFGAVVDPAMEGEVRVTVIATGFDRREAKETGAGRPAGVIQFPQRQVSGLRASGQQAQAAAGGGGSAPGAPARRNSPQIQPPPGQAAPVAEPLSDMEIPTFIRRQMD